MSQIYDNICIVTAGVQKYFTLNVLISQQATEHWIFVTVRQTNTTVRHTNIIYFVKC